MKNRHGDTIEFVKIDEETYQFKVSPIEGGEEPLYWQFSSNEDGRLVSADPPGGPFIGLETDISQDRDFSLKVRGIEIVDRKVLLKVQKSKRKNKKKFDQLPLNFDE